FDESIICYDFPGRPKSVVHTRFSADLVESISETTTYAYDRAGRPLSVTHRLGQNDPVEIAHYSYDELGRLQTDRRAGLAELTRLTDYNVQSQPVSIASDLFSQRLSYTPGGRVSRIDWSCPDGSGNHSFEFGYDNILRLTSAVYGMGDPDKSTRYNCSYTYDSHGNLLSIERKGLGDGGKFSLIDDLTLTYDGNRLIHVKDVASDPTYKDAFSFTDDNIITLGGGNEYAYDANGNIVSDTNKGISVSYDINNRPKRISKGINHWVDYIYDARGRKLRQTHATRILVWQPSPMMPGQQPKPRVVTSTTDYCGNIIYRDNKPFQLFFDGGYVSLDEPEPSYRFFLPDHLGSIRAVADTNGQLLQSNHYYPYGMLMGESSGGDLQNRKFGGKELDREGGLDLYDQEARLYDSAIGRFLRPDDSAEKYYSKSPYSYCGGDPVNCIDPTGCVIE
ncbi:MAG: RHS repeat-associated core domain-containing protein, partial [Paramuribaculum sp.]|nr:RHS repeat-associated core domain-containing protein [Paramuribaculum sp.]